MDATDNKSPTDAKDAANTSPEVKTDDGTASEVKTSDSAVLECKECGAKVKDYLADHLTEAHGLSASAYLSKYPGAPTISQRLIDRYNKSKKTPRRELPPKSDSLKVTFASIDFSVSMDVPEEACLPMPEHYRVPRHGLLGEDIQHAAVALSQKRSLYVFGMPGSGKDAFFHAWSYLTRTPAIIKQVRPGTDIESWFFTRAFTEKGTFWEEGEALKALRDGYLTKTGRRVPFLFLVTDFDRADKEQAEHLRLICDSIQGRIDGPAGKVYKVLSGSIVAATGNTAGAGDERGRMISANPIDASLFERFQRKFMFRWMEWKDEGDIVRAKFPLLVQKCPSAFDKMGLVTKALREAILNSELYGEFSHRALCSILGHAQDILECNTAKRVPKNLLKLASRAWVDGLPDEEARDAARKIMDPHIGTLDEGDTSHISNSPLATGWSK